MAEPKYTSAGKEWTPPDYYIVEHLDAHRRKGDFRIRITYTDLDKALSEIKVSVEHGARMAIYPMRGVPDSSPLKRA
jgi:hypothetical protein